MAPHQVPKDRSRADTGSQELLLAAGSAQSPSPTAHLPYEGNLVEFANSHGDQSASLDWYKTYGPVCRFKGYLGVSRLLLSCEGSDDASSATTSMSSTPKRLPSCFPKACCSRRTLPTSQ